MPATKTTDDLDAVRAVVEAMRDFKPDEQQRILRWAAEKLGLPQPFVTGSVAAGPSPVSLSSSIAAPTHAPSAPAGAETTQDIRSFVAAKNPRRDVQFAATIAYYFRFEAPQAERKDTIKKEDLHDACRKVGRDRLKHPYQTLMNAHNLGLLDKGPDKATFAINSVGENLVAMILPGDQNSTARSAKKRTRKKVAKGAAKKMSAKKAMKA